MDHWILRVVCLSPSIFQANTLSSLVQLAACNLFSHMFSWWTVCYSNSFCKLQSWECVFSIRDEEESIAELMWPHVGLGCGWTLFLVTSASVRWRQTICMMSNNWLEIRREVALTSLESEQSYRFRWKVYTGLSINLVRFFVILQILPNMQISNSGLCCSLWKISRTGIFAF